MEPIAPYSRVVSGKGTLTIPDTFISATQLFLYVDVIRENKSVYRNYDYNPSQSFFAHIVTTTSDYVYQTFDVKFDAQVFELSPRSDIANVLRAVKCLEKAVRNYVFLGTANPGVVFLNQLADFQPDRYIADELKFECFGGTALRLTLTGYERATCGDSPEEPSPPPPPPPPPTKVPSDTPVDVSPPEDSDPDDTDPYPGDMVPPPNPGLPTGEPCQAYVVTYNVTDPGNENFTPQIGRTIQVLGVIESQYNEEIPESPGSYEVGIIGGELVEDVCTSGKRYVLVSGGTNQLNLEIVSIVPVTP